MEEKIIRKRFDIQVTEANKTYKEDFELEKHTRLVRGILVTSDRDDLLYYRGSQKIELNNEELFPEDYESKLLLSGLNVPPNKRYYFIGDLEPGNGIIEMDYTDTDHAKAPFEPYRVSLYVEYII